MSKLGPSGDKQEPFNFNITDDILDFVEREKDCEAIETKNSFKVAGLSQNYYQNAVIENIIYAHDLNDNRISDVKITLDASDSCTWFPKPEDQVKLGQLNVDPKTTTDWEDFKSKMTEAEDLAWEYDDRLPKKCAVGKVIEVYQRSVTIYVHRVEQESDKLAKIIILILIL